MLLSPGELVNTGTPHRYAAPSSDFLLAGEPTLARALEELLLELGS